MLDGVFAVISSFANKWLSFFIRIMGVSIQRIIQINIVESMAVIKAKNGICYGELMLNPTRVPHYCEGYLSSP